MATSLPILPSPYPIFSFLSFSPYLRRFHRKPPSSIQCKLRRKPPPDFDTVSTPTPSLRQTSESRYLLDSKYLAGRGDVLTTTADDDDATSNNRKNKYSTNAIRFFGVDLTADNIAVAMVYFVQGVLGLSRLAVSFYLKDDLHLDPAETAVISGISALPWLVKPLYGFISDSFPLFGFRRRSYLLLSGLLGALSWSLMASFVDDKYGVAFCMLLGSLSVAFSDVVSLLLLWKKVYGVRCRLCSVLMLYAFLYFQRCLGKILSVYFPLFGSMNTIRYFQHLLELFITYHVMFALNYGSLCPTNRPTDLRAIVLYSVVDDLYLTFQLFTS